MRLRGHPASDHTFERRKAGSRVTKDLEEVAAQCNRYQIKTPSLTSMSVTRGFRTGNLAGFLFPVQLRLPIPIQEVVLY